MPQLEHSQPTPRNQNEKDSAQQLVFESGSTRSSTPELFFRENSGREDDHSETSDAHDSLKEADDLEKPAQENNGASPHKVPPHLFQKHPCKFFMLGNCKHGENCTFSHRLTGTPASPKQPKNVQNQKSNVFNVNLH